MHLVASALRADAGDLNAFFGVLATTLGDALPGKVDVERGGFLGRGEPRAITVTLNDSAYEARRGEGAVTCTRRSVVRGITLKNEDLERAKTVLVEALAPLVKKPADELRFDLEKNATYPSGKPRRFFWLAREVDEAFYEQLFAVCADLMTRLHSIPQPVIAKVHPRYRTPWVITAIVTAVCAVVAGFTPVGVLEEMVNIGTLSAFVLVSVGVIVLRRTRPDLPRAFRVPWVPWLPAASALVCLYLMVNLPVETWLRFVVWLAIGFAIYFLYARRRSVLA